MAFEKNNQKRIVSVLFLAVCIIFCIALLPYFMGFARTGFSEPSIFQQYMIYAYFGGIMLIAILALYFIEIFVKEKDKLYGDGIGFNNQGDFPGLKFFGKYTTFQLTLLAVILVSIFGFANFLTLQQSFFGVGKTAQQFTPVDNLVFRTFLIPASENLGMAFVIALYLVTLRWYCRKNKVSKQNFAVFAIVGSLILGGIYGYGLHQLVYSGQEKDLIRTTGIWTLGALVTVLIGNFVIFWMLHLINNLFIDLKAFFPNEMMIVFFISFIIFLSVLYWFLYIRKPSSKFKFKR